MSSFLRPVMGRPASAARSSSDRSCGRPSCGVALTTTVRPGVPRVSHSWRTWRVKWSAPSSGCAAEGSGVAGCGCGAGAGAARAGRWWRRVCRESGSTAQPAAAHPAASRASMHHGPQPGVCLAVTSMAAARTSGAQRRILRPAPGASLLRARTQPPTCGGTGQRDDGVDGAVGGEVRSRGEDRGGQGVEGALQSDAARHGHGVPPGCTGARARRAARRMTVSVVVVVGGTGAGGPAGAVSPPPGRAAWRSTGRRPGRRSRGRGHARSVRSTRSRGAGRRRT